MLLTECNLLGMPLVEFLEMCIRKAVYPPLMNLRFLIGLKKVPEIEKNERRLFKVFENRHE